MRSQSPRSRWAFAVCACVGAACGSSNDSDVNEVGGSGRGGANGTMGGTAGTPADGEGGASGGEGGTTTGGGSAGAGGSDKGPRVMVRIGNFMRPDFLALDACFGTVVGGVTNWQGPLWRDDWGHSATFNRVTAYRSIAPGPGLVRFVSRGDSDCETPIVGLPDRAVDVPLVLDHGARTWFTVMALGDATGQAKTPFGIKTVVDREVVASTPFGLRVVALDPGLGPIEFGSLENPDYTGYDKRIDDVSYGMPSAYTSWTMSYGTPLYFGFKVFLEGQSAGAPVIVGDRAQSDAQGRGSWTVFVLPGGGAGAAETWSLCADGTEGPRLCYPCGTPGCEGK